MGISGQTGLGHAVGWGDIDNDGDPELGVSNQEGNGFWFYLNEGTHFTNITTSGGLSGLGGNKIIIVEVTGDDYNDLILRTRSGTQYLFESNGDGTFNNITSVAGIGNASVYNIADFNNDGHLDLLSVANDNFSILYNNGNATFQAAQVISPYESFWGVAVLDYNRDGFMDIYHTTYGNSPNILLHNNGNGTFTNTTSQAGLEYPDGAHGLDVGDFNNDGWVDIYLGSYSSLNCKLFQNNGNGTFTDVAVITGTTGHHDTRTVSFIDYNNDGWLDIFSSHHDFYEYSNTMLRNNGDYTFTEVAGSIGLSGPFIGDYFGQGWADYNLDGAIDLFAAGHIDKYRLFKNTNCPGSFLNIHLIGIESNPNGIGTQVDVWLSGQKVSRNVLPSGGFHDFNNLDLHIGLGGAYSADSIIVYWPSGIIQKLGMTIANQFLTIIEDGTTNINEPGTYSNTILLTISPNPIIDCAKIKVNLVQEGQLEVSVFNLHGIQLRTLFNEIMEKGENWFEINVNGLTSGVYFLKVQGRRFMQFEKIVVL
jgi:hypothetical protein